MQEEVLIGKSFEEIQGICAAMNVPKFVATQLVQWLYQKRIKGFDEMTNLSKSLRSLLSKQFKFGITLPAKVQVSADETKKYLFSVKGEQFVESVMIPEKERRTLCVSTQIGCRMRCAFCVTGAMRFGGNLTSADIINQILSVSESKMLTNIVFMGMGEPFDNIDATLKSLDILTSPWGFAMSPKRITVSTIGIIPAMQRFFNESQCHLAVSLHSPFAEERKFLMPIQERYPIEKIIDIIRTYNLGGQRRVSFEYIVFKGFNDTAQHVRALSKLLNGIHCRINLIRFHESEIFDMKSPQYIEIRHFAEMLGEKHITTTIRASRGEDILAACGLLSANQKGY